MSMYKELIGVFDAVQLNAFTKLLEYARDHVFSHHNRGISISLLLEREHVALRVGVENNKAKIQFLSYDDAEAALSFQWPADSALIPVNTCITKLNKREMSERTFLRFVHRTFSALPLTSFAMMRVEKRKIAFSSDDGIYVCSLRPFNDEWEITLLNDTSATKKRCPMFPLEMEMSQPKIAYDEYQQILDVLDGMLGEKDGE